MKTFVNKYKAILTVGIVATVTAIIIYNSIKEVNKVNAKQKQKNLKKLADEDKKKWEGKKETDKEMSDTLINYWKLVGLNFTPSQMQSLSHQKTYPWSASYVTHLIKNSGFNFIGGSSHSKYAVNGKQNRQENKENTYWAYRPSENKKIEIGDIIVKNRDGGNYNYDTITSGVKSHGDVIIDIQKEGTKFIAIFQGGNLSNSVDRGKITLTENGFLPSDSKYFLQLKYNEK